MPTPYHALYFAHELTRSRPATGMDKDAMEDRHVLFQDDDGPVYLAKMFRRAGIGTLAAE